MIRFFPKWPYPVACGGHEGDWSRLQRDQPIRNLRNAARCYLLLANPPQTSEMPLGVICCPRQSTAIQPHTGNFSGPPRRLLAHHRLFRLVISLLSRPPATGAAQCAPYEPRLPAQKCYSARRRTSAPDEIRKGRPELHLHRPPPDQRPGRASRGDRMTQSTNGQLQGIDQAARVQSQYPQNTLPRCTQHPGERGWLSGKNEGLAAPVVESRCLFFASWCGIENFR